MAIVEVSQAFDENGGGPGDGVVDDVDTSVRCGLGNWEVEQHRRRVEALRPACSSRHDPGGLVLDGEATGPWPIGFPNGQDYVYKIAGGQLVLVHSPGV